MEKLQILFPTAQLRRLRSVAQHQDRPVSELVRNAVEQWLERSGPPVEELREPMPTFAMGPILMPASEFREAAYRDEDYE